MKSSHKTIILIISSFVLVAFVDSYYLYTKNLESVTYLPHTMFLAVCCFAWCKQHALENAVEKLGYYPLFCALIGFLGVPIYGYAKFGFKRGSKILGYMVLCLLISATLTVAVDYLVRYVYV